MRRSELKARDPGERMADAATKESRGATGVKTALGVKGMGWKSGGCGA